MHIESFETSFDDCYAFGTDAVLIDAAEIRANNRSKLKEEKMKKKREIRSRLDKLLESKRLRDELGYLGDWLPPQDDE